MEPQAQLVHLGLQEILDPLEFRVLLGQLVKWDFEVSKVSRNQTIAALRQYQSVVNSQTLAYR